MGCHFLLQGILPTQESNLPPALAGRFFTTSTTWEVLAQGYFLPQKRPLCNSQEAILLTCEGPVWVSQSSHGWRNGCDLSHRQHCPILHSDTHK